MACFSVLDAEKYGGHGGAGFFSLKNDGDSARVRLMYEHFDDVKGYAVHSVTINGKKRFVDCLREYGEPTEKCPLCRHGEPVQVRVFIPVYLVEEDRQVIWERGKGFIPRLKALFAANAEDRAMVSNVYQISKRVEEGKCSYDIQLERSGIVEMEDFEVAPQNIYGGLVLQKTVEEMEQYVATGSFTKSA